MNQRWLWLNLALVASLSLAGCYNGWDRGGNKGPGGGGGSGKPVPEPKRIGLAFLDVITMSPEAMRAQGCSAVPSSLIELRAEEARQRAKAIYAVLAEMADQVRMLPITITKSDCKTLSAIETRSNTSSESEIGQLTPELKRKPAVHVRLVLWNGDFSSGYPSYRVYGTWPWSIMSALQNKGISKQLSVTHFATTSSSSGYVGYWKQWSSSEMRFDATVVEHPSVDEDGVAKIGDSVQKSTTDFTAWLSEKVMNL